MSQVKCVTVTYDQAQLQQQLDETRELLRRALVLFPATRIPPPDMAPQPTPSSRWVK
jgi:hypothetical protein